MIKTEGQACSSSEDSGNHKGDARRPSGPSEGETEAEK